MHAVIQIYRTGIRVMGNKNNDDNNNINRDKKRQRFLKILIAVLGIAIIVVLAVFYTVYYRFAHAAKELARETADAYAYGNGDTMADLIAPGYVESYESKSKVLSISDIQDIYIDKFRTYAEGKVGTIKKIDCNITDIQAVSNIEAVQKEFESNGVKGVSQYRSVGADWIVTGKEGDQITVQIQEYMLKCNDGWYVDYILFPEEVGGNTIVDDTEDSTEASTETLEQ